LLVAAVQAWSGNRFDYRIQLITDAEDHLDLKELSDIVVPGSRIVTQANPHVEVSGEEYQVQVVEEPGRPGTINWHQFELSNAHILAAEYLLRELEKWMRHRCARDVDLRTLRFRLKLFHFGRTRSKPWSAGALFRDLIITRSARS